MLYINFLTHNYSLPYKREIHEEKVPAKTSKLGVKYCCGKSLQKSVTSEKQNKTKKSRNTRASELNVKKHGI